MEATLDEILTVAQKATEQLEGPLASELDSNLSLSSNQVAQSSSLTEKIAQAIQRLDKLQLMLTPPHFTLVEKTLAATDSKVLLCAARHHFADHLAREGPLSVEELAKVAGLKGGGLVQVMRYLVEMGFFDWDGKSGKISQNRVSDLLRQDHWTQWSNSIELYAGEGGDMLKYLPDQLVFEQPRTSAQMFHDTDKSWYEYMAAQGAAERFHKAIKSVGTAETPGLIATYPWNEVVTEAVLDVGAGAGDFVYNYLSHFPEATAATFELPKTAELISERFAKDPEITKRLIDIHAGDFFKDPVPSYSIYFMKWVLHNLDDEQSIALLREIRKAMKVKPGISRVLVAEGVLLPGRLGRIARATDVRMFTRLGSRERTLEDFDRLARESGFRIEKVITPRGCLTNIIDLRSVESG